MGDLVSFSLSGRTSRRHYWAALLLLTLLGFALESLQDFLFGITISETGFNVATGLISAAGLVVGWLTITLFVRRFHDIDRTGWWALSVFVPFFVPLGVIVLGCLRGSDGEASRRFFQQMPLQVIHLDGNRHQFVFRNRFHDVFR